MTDATDSGDLALVSPVRLGTMLSRARSDRGLTLADVADQTGGALTHGTLASVERGSTRVTDDDLTTLAALYGVSTTSLIPTRSRLVIDVAEGDMAVNSLNESFRPGSTDPSEVLSRYLSMVYSMRSVRPGAHVPLRIEDLYVLGTALDTDAAFIEADLDSLMRHGGEDIGWRTRLLRSRVLLPAAGVLVAFCGAGTLLMIDSGDSTVAPGPPVASSAPVVPAAPENAEIGGAIVQERNPDGSAGAVVARRTDAPGPVVDSPSTSLADADPTVTERAPGADASGGAAVIGESSSIER